MKNWFIVFILVPSITLAAVKSIVSTGGSKYVVVADDVEISEHTMQHTATLKALQQPCNKRECIVYVRQTFELRIIVTGTPEEGNRLQVTWGAPDERENGDPLLISDVTRYEIELNGIIYPVDKNVTSWTSDPLSQNVLNFRMRTVADGEKVGAFSEMVQVII